MSLLMDLSCDSTSPPVWAVWIEIRNLHKACASPTRRRPCGRCGLKWLLKYLSLSDLRRRPCGRCGLKCISLATSSGSVSRRPCGRCGLKSHCRSNKKHLYTSPPVWAVWIEILIPHSLQHCGTCRRPCGRCGLKSYGRFQHL